MSYLFDMCLRSFWKYYNVIRVDYCELPFNCTQMVFIVLWNGPPALSNRDVIRMSWNNRLCDAKEVSALPPLETSFCQCALFTCKIEKIVAFLNKSMHLGIQQQDRSQAQWLRCVFCNQQRAGSCHRHLGRTQLVQPNLSDPVVLFGAKTIGNAQSGWFSSMTSSSSVLPISLFSNMCDAGPAGCGTKCIGCWSYGKSSILCWATLASPKGTFHMNSSSGKIFII